MSRKNASRASEIIGRILFFTLLASMVFSLVRFLPAPEALAPGAEFEKTKSDYLLTLSQCVLGMVVMLLPSVIDRRWKLGIANFIYILYYIFLYCAVFLGEMFDFYYRFPHWDTLLHFFSGAMLGALGFILVDLLNRSEHVRVSLSPLFVSLFAFCFALACGAVWEIYEFSADGLLGLNMQKCITAQGEALIGRAALVDTMDDLIVDSLAALAVSVVGYFSTIRRRECANSEVQEAIA